MKGNPKVIEALNEILLGELTAINQYFLHARMCKNWGYERIAKKIEARRKAKMESDIATLEKETHKTPEAGKSRITREDKHETKSETAPQAPVKRKSMEEIDKEIEKLLSDDMGTSGTKL